MKPTERCAVLRARSRRHALPAVAGLLAVAACAPLPVAAPGTICEAAGFVVSDDFPGARRGRCTVLGAGRVRLSIGPEDAAVTNPSGWYAFQVTPRRPGPATIVLDYGRWEHRYVPKRHAGNGEAAVLAGATLRVSRDESRATLKLELDGQPLRIVAQELLLPDDYAAWARALAARRPVTLSTLGTSLAGRPLPMLESGADNPETVLLVGRQHPPEVSGAIAMLAFLEALYAETPLARDFRERFRVISIPLMNPDGVAAGHWRHNLGERDLNRDWGPFTQPETRAVAALLDRLDADGARLRAFVDFHSTWRNLLYTQADDEATDPPGFTSDWLHRAAQRLPAYEFTREPRTTSDTANGKNYMYRRYRIPSVTYEVGDETPRDVVRDAAAVMAEEFMRRLLKAPAVAQDPDPARPVAARDTANRAGPAPTPAARFTAGREPFKLRP